MSKKKKIIIITLSIIALILVIFVASYIAFSVEDSRKFSVGFVVDKLMNRNV